MTATATVEPAVTPPQSVCSPELHYIPMSKIQVVAGHNPRGAVEEDAELLAMAQTMRDRGCLQPIRVRDAGEGEYLLTAGERRYRAAALAGLTEIPASIVPPGGDPAADQEADAIEALIENELRVDLTPLQRALGYQGFIDRGLTVRGIAEALGATDRQRPAMQRRIKDHLAILLLPADVQEQVAKEVIPMLAVKGLVKLAAIHPQLTHAAVSAVTQLDEYERYTWAQVASEPIYVAINGPDELPPGIFLVEYQSYRLDSLPLSEKAKKNLAAYQELTGQSLDRFGFSPSDAEHAEKLKACVAEGMYSLIVGEEVAASIAEDVIAARLKSARADARTRQAAANAAPGPDATDADSSDGAVGAASGGDVDDWRALCEAATTFNGELGRLVFKGMAKLRPDERVVRILASVGVSDDLRGLAARGARLTLPGWHTEEKGRGGKVKRVYLEPADAKDRASQFLAGAATASEAAGRVVSLIALAVFADENAIAPSRRSFYAVSFGGPWGAQAEVDLCEIVRERIKEGQLPALDDLLAERRERIEAAARASALLSRLDDATDDELAAGLTDAQLAWGQYHPAAFRIAAEQEARQGARTSD